MFIPSPIPLFELKEIAPKQYVLGLEISSYEDKKGNEYRKVKRRDGRIEWWIRLSYRRNRL